MKFLQHFKKINPIKHDKPRKSKYSGCQKGYRINAYHNGNIPREQETVQKIDTDSSHHRTKNKIDKPLNLSPHRPDNKHQNAYD